MINPESIHYLFEVGNKTNQEDYIWPIPGEATAYDKVFIVCDGAGNFENGEIASKLICQFMAAKVSKFDEHKMSAELVNKLLGEARDRLVTYAREYKLDSDLATTFSMLILYDQHVFMSWYGDSRMYHVRDGEILFKTEDHALVNELVQLDEMSNEDDHVQSRHIARPQGIKADSSLIEAETKWIEYIQDGDYFLLCSKGLMENVTDDDIKSLLSQNIQANADLADSFKQVVVEKTPGNYSMYLVRVNLGTQKRVVKKNGIPAKKNGTQIASKPPRRIVTPISILTATIVAMLIMFLYFRKPKAASSAPTYTNQTTQPVDAVRHDSVPGAITKAEQRKAVPSLTATDSAKTTHENPPPPPAPKKEEPVAIQAEEKPKQTEEKPKQINEAPVTSVPRKKTASQLMLKLTTDEACKLKITNTDSEDVIDWDLSPNDNGTIYLKPGKYSIVATSVINGSKTKTYQFDVKAGDTHTTQNIHIAF